MEWTVLSNPGWIANLGEPSIIVRVGGEPCLNADHALTDDPEALKKTLIEMLAHDADDATIGALVRTILEPARLEGIGTWRWSGRVLFVRLKDSEFLGSEL